MSKKNLAQRLKYLFLGAVVVAAGVAAIAFWQFRGNALRGEYELFLSRKADYQALTDSLMPHLKHRAAFRFYARHLNLEQSF